MGSSTSGDKHGGRSDAIISDRPPEKPNNTLEALENIQHYYVAEKAGVRVDENFFSTLDTIKYFEIGFKGAFISGLVAAALTPFAIAVMENYLPVFGSSEPSTYDQVFVFVLALSFSIGYSFFYGNIGKYYIGPITKQMIRWLLGGVMTGAIIKFAIAFIFYHFIYFVVLMPETVEQFLLFFKSTFAPETLIWAYNAILEFKPIFLTSAWFIAFSTLLFITVPTTSMLYYGVKWRIFSDSKTAKRFFK
ncbi:MAG: hypothetical protein IEMM0002_1062 [bacterium]|nr:MAG: hypothetical protein IEMM0002_1062 [bacterium]